MIRLDKLLGNLGYCSRREAWRYINKEAVLLAGQKPQSADQKVDPQQVTVGGLPLDPGSPLVLMLHKPAGYTCSHDDAGALVFELLPPRFSNRKPPLNCVGRLDKDTTGLLILTDDGALLHELTSPRHQITKLYEATLARDLRGDEAPLFASGTLLLQNETKPLKPATLEIMDSRHVRVILSEGRYHQVRRMFAATGNHVTHLHRSRLGLLTLGDLPAGQFRLLTPADVELAMGQAGH